MKKILPMSYAIENESRIYVGLGIQLKPISRPPW